jgi:hypothetical protein
MKKLLLLIIAAQVILYAAVTATKSNYKTLLKGSKEEKIAALNFSTEKKVKDITNILKEMLTSEKDVEVRIKAILTIGALVEKKLSLDVVDVYQNNSKSEIRFACILALLQLQDIRTLSAIKKAYESEKDIHIKQSLQLIMDSLKNKK